MTSAMTFVSTVQINMCLLSQLLFVFQYAYFISRYHQFFSILIFRTIWQIEQLMRDFLAEKTIKHKMLKKVMRVVLRMKKMFQIV